MYPHTKFGIPTSKNIGDMDRTRKRDGRTDGRTDGLTDGRTVRLLYASQSSFGGIKTCLRIIINIFLPINYNMCFGAKKNRHIETIILSTHNTVLCKAPTFTNILWECLTVHQISPFINLPCFLQITFISRGNCRNGLFMASYTIWVMSLEKEWTAKAQTSLHIHTVWSYLENYIMESFS